MIGCGLAMGLALAAAVPAAAAEVRELVMTPGKGVSFYMGAKHGITTFLTEGGLCKLTVAVGDSPDTDGMNPGASTKMVTAVVPGQTTRLETTDGGALNFTCNAGAQSMRLEMPAEAKLKNAPEQ